MTTKKEKIASICILSYNRPESLYKLLNSIDSESNNELEIVICDDFSPKKKQISNVVNEYKKNNFIDLYFIQNKKNVGYDKTFLELVKNAKGKWLLFMGDDDEFVPMALEKTLNFLKKNLALGYVLKSHYLIHRKGKKEKFRYFDKTVFLKPGQDSYKELFRKSVYIAGFIIRREYTLPYLTNRFDGTMLIQLYLLAEVVLRYPSAYFDEPLTQQFASHEHNIGDVMYDRESKKFIPRKPTLDISLNFLSSFEKITKFIDKKYKFDSTIFIKRDMSKYFYPSLALHRKSGLFFFWKYVRELNRLGFNVTVYYYIYVFFLSIFGKRFCDLGIFYIKKILGKTPRL